MRRLNDDARTEHRVTATVGGVDDLPCVQECHILYDVVAIRIFGAHANLLVIAVVADVIRTAVEYDDRAWNAVRVGHSGYR